MTVISNNNNIINTKTTVLAERVVLTLSAIVTVFTLGWVLGYCRFGIDFTDEGYYLAWISNPFNYAVSATQFGFIYHPLYELLDGNIAAFRQANILITFGLSWILANVFLQVVFGKQSYESVSRLIISAAFANISVVTLVFAGMWLSTPGYNSLTLQALLLSGIGLLMADKEFGHRSLLGWLIIGVGGWLTFMAKPSSAAALVLCASFYLVFAGKFSFRLLIISMTVAVGLVIISAFVIDGSVIAFIERLREGVEVYKILGGGIHDHLLRMDEFNLGEKGREVLIAFTSVFFLAVYLSQAKKIALVQVSVILAVTFALGCIAIILGIINQTPNVGLFQGMLILAVPLAAILAGFLILPLEKILQIPRGKCALGITFLLLPYVYAFGTGNNYWLLEANAGIFWVLAGLVLVSPVAYSQSSRPLLVNLALAVQLVTVVLVQAGIESPYRQPQPLRLNDSQHEVGRHGSNLVLSQGFSQYFTESSNVAKQAGFKAGFSMIDLSGQSLAVLHGFGAINLGLAWGGYPGSDLLLKALLQKVSCADLAPAWLLFDPTGPAKISPEILSSFGADIDRDYKVVGTFKTAEGAGGYKEIREQQILKPVRSVNAAIDACTLARRSNN